MGELTCQPVGARAYWREGNQTMKVDYLADHPECPAVTQKATRDYPVHRNNLVG